MILLLALMAHAESLNYEQAKERLLQEGTDVQTAGYALQQAEAALRERHHAWDPDLGYDTGFRLSLGNGGLTPLATVGLSSSIPIYTGGANRALLRQAEANERYAQAMVDVERRRVILNFGTGLLLVQQARAAVAVEEGRVTSEQATLQRILALVAAGSRTRADQLQQEAAFAEAESALVAATQTARDAELAMLLLLHLDPLSPWELPIPPEFSVGMKDRAQWTEQALKQRPEIAAGRAMLQRAEAAVEQEKSGLRPQLSGNLGVDGGMDPRSPSSATAQATAGLSLSGAVLDRGGTRSALAQAEAAVKEAQARLEAQEWAIRGQVVQAVGHREAAITAGLAAERRVAAAEEARRLVEARYNAGAALYSELETARFAFLQAQRARVEAVSALAQAEWALRWAVGEGM